MNSPNTKTGYAQPSLNLPAEVIRQQQEAEAQRMEQEALMLTQGTLMKHFKKRYRDKEITLREFGRVAGEVSEIEADTLEEGVLVEARWRHKFTEQSAAAVFATLFLGIFGALLSSGDSVKVEYATKHRLPEDIVRGFMVRRIFLTMGYVLGSAAAIICGLYTMVCLAIAFERYATSAEKWAFVLPLVLTFVFGFVAYKCKRWLVPPLLRIYSGGKFDLVKLKRSEPSSLRDVR